VYRINLTVGIEKDTSESLRQETTRGGTTGEGRKGKIFVRRPVFFFRLQPVFAGEAR
jgi:hypothetical protein